MSAATHSVYPGLPGFAKENRELVYAMTDAGWTGRMTSKGHFLAKAPDGKTQITVPAKNGNNRGLKNAHAAFIRWLKANMPAAEAELYDLAKAEDDPLVKDVLAESLVRKQTERIVRDKIDREIVAEVQAFKALIDSASVTVRPWLARKQPGRDGGVRYESQAVLERVWPDGKTDYVCAECEWESENPRSVAAHYGKAHTMKGETPPAEVGPLHPDPTYTEPTTTRDYRPTERLIMAAAEAIRALMEDEEATPESIARCFLEWAHYRDDIEHESRPLVPLTDRQILDKVRMLVGQPDQTTEIDALKAEIAILEHEITRLRDERTALRELLA